MVCLLGGETCNCGVCSGHSEPDPRTLKGELVFGGWKCMCPCHQLSGQRKEDFIKRKYQSVEIKEPK